MGRVPGTKRGGRTRAAAAILVVVSAAGCGPILVKGQALALRVLPAKERVVRGGDHIAALHYYGSGGWGILWRGHYLLAAPYFSNHGMFALALGRLRPDLQAIREGFASTPVEKTSAILVGHGHIDHAGDLAGYFESGVLKGKPTLIANRTTVNILATSRSRFGCVAALDYDADRKPVTACPTPAMRVTPIHSDHAPHVRLLGANLGLYSGVLREPRTTPPARADDFRGGYTWAYLIDLLDPDGRIAFRIHYMDAAASPPHGILLDPRRSRARDVDVHIACVPGYHLVDDYPDTVLRHHRVRYVIGGHWEDFFRSRRKTLRPVPLVLDQHKLNAFVGRIESALGTRALGVRPLEPGCQPPKCGPRGANWALPAPGETIRFRTGEQRRVPGRPLGG